MVTNGSRQLIWTFVNQFSIRGATDGWLQLIWTFSIQHKGATNGPRQLIRIFANQYLNVVEFLLENVRKFQEQVVDV